MGYYMRYIVTSEQGISASQIEAGLKQVDPHYSVADGELLMYGDDLHGRLEINLPGDDLFDEEIEELAEDVEDAQGAGKSLVLETLRGARSIVALQVLWQGREPGENLKRIDPLWGWLFASRAGLLQADDEGYYDQSGLILAVA